MCYVFNKNKCFLLQNRCMAKAAARITNALICWPDRSVMESVNALMVSLMSEDAVCSWSIFTGIALMWVKKNRRKTITQIYLLIIIMQDIDCYFGFDRESVVCAEQRCRCADGFYQRADNICRRKSMSKFFNSILNLLIFKDFFEPRCWRCMCGASGLLRRRWKRWRRIAEMRQPSLWAAQCWSADEFQYWIHRWITEDDWSISRSTGASQCVHFVRVGVEVSDGDVPTVHY